MAQVQATLGGGCFWCLYPIFQEIKGVEKVVSGYAGGETANPTYEQVVSGRTGHAQVNQITLDPKALSYRDLLELFFTIHNPTTLNRQDYDVGTDYRSIILYHDDQQQQIAVDVKANFAPKLWDDPIVTEIVPLTKFYPAEDYHQDYFNKHPEQAYCQIIINPKLQKFRERFESKLKK